MMKRILKNKRGMAIESAVVFMLLTFTLSLLMTGAVMIMHLRVQISDKTIQREITIEQIGEMFVNGDGDEYSDYLGNYEAVKGTNNGNTTLTLKNKIGQVLLYIEKNAGGEVVVWQYSAP